VCVYIYIEQCFEKDGRRGGDRVGIGASSGPAGTMDQEICTGGPFKGLK
jgi:hypothetical protein